MTIRTILVLVLLRQLSRRSVRLSIIYKFCFVLEAQVAGQRVIEERNGSWQTLKTYVWGLQYVDELIQINTAGMEAGFVEVIDEEEWFFTAWVGPASYWVMQDANYNVLGVLECTGQYAERYEYTPYGERITYSGGPDPLLPTPSPNPVGLFAFIPANLNDFGHQGKMHDQATGLMHYNARMYSPTLQVFMGPDPIGYIDGTNLYQYVRSNPVRYVDPKGTEVYALCTIEEYLKKAGVTGFEVTKKAKEDKWALYTKTAKGKGNDLKTEILVTMINSPRRFTIKEGSVENLELHIKARINVIGAAKSVKFAFGKDTVTAQWNKLLADGDPYSALEDLWTNPKGYKMMCASAIAVVFNRGLALSVGKEAYNKATNENGFSPVSGLHSEDVNDWIPGDHGHVENPDMKDANKRRDVPAGYEGENIIYLGQANGGKWWGFMGNGSTYKTLDEWVITVGGWANPKLDKGKALQQKASMVDKRRQFPKLGLQK